MSDKSVKVLVSYNWKYFRSLLACKVWIKPVHLLNLGSKDKLQDGLAF